MLLLLLHVLIHLRCNRLAVMLQIRRPTSVLLGALDFFVDKLPIEGKTPRLTLTEEVFLHVVEPLPLANLDEKWILYASLHVLVIIVVVLTHAEPARKQLVAVTQSLELEYIEH